MGREWKIGDWAEYVGTRCLVIDVRKGLGGSIVDVVNHANAEWRDGCEDAIRSPSCDHTELKHLPACTGWDWAAPKPIEPPVGYRLMSDDETISDGDMFYQDEWKQTGVRAITVRQSLDSYGRFGIVAYACKIEPPAGYRLMDRKEIVKEGDVSLTRRMGGPRWECTGSGALGCTVAYRMENYGELAYARKIEPVYRPFASAEEFKPHREKWVYFLGDISNQLLITSFTAKGIWHAGKHTTWEAMFSQARFEDASPFGVLESNPLPVP